MKNKLLFIFIFIVLTGGLYYLYSISQLDSALQDAGATGFGKEIIITVSDEDISDYRFIESSSVLDLWNEDEKEKLINFMKRNNLKLKSGEYKLNQATTFEKSLEIFRFQKQLIFHERGQ